MPHARIDCMLCEIVFISQMRYFIKIESHWIVFEYWPFFTEIVFKLLSSAGLAGKSAEWIEQKPNDVELSVQDLRLMYGTELVVFGAYNSE